MTRYTVHSHWDPEAGVWWADSPDVPGLVAEADSYAAMIGEIRALVPELLAANIANYAAEPIDLTITFFAAACPRAS